MHCSFEYSTCNIHCLLCGMCSLNINSLFSVAQKAVPQSAPSLKATATPSPPSISPPSFPSPKDIQPPSTKDTLPPVAQTPQTPSGPDLVPELMQKPKTGMAAMLGVHKTLDARQPSSGSMSAMQSKRPVTGAGVCPCDACMCFFVGSKVLMTSAFPA